MTIYTLGYSGWRIEDVVAKLKELDAMLVDVRMVPRSRNVAFNSSSLLRQFQDRYVWLQEFGNRNYKGTVEQIEIADFLAGTARLKEIAGSRRDFILLCGCADVNMCHRKIVAERLAKAWNKNVVHLTPPPKREQPREPMLF